MAKKKSIEEQILGRVKRTPKYHTIYHKTVELTPEQMEWLREYENEHAELPHFGATEVDLVGDNLWLTFDY